MISKAMMAAALAAALGVSASAWAQASGDEAARAKEACAVAAAEHFQTTVDAMDVDVRQQRTRTRVIKLDLQITLEDGARRSAACTFSRRSGEVTDFQARS